MKHAFSLVELSIVLVILGLLTGGILTGQNLIRAAELRSVTTEYQAYQTAVNTFRDKYFALPGDMRNATDFWGEMSGGTCPNATGGTGTETCNGDGDGFIDNNGAAAGQASELFGFWQHLANAGLIEGSFTGISGTSSSHHVLGENAPASKFSSAGWTAFYRSPAVSMYQFSAVNTLQLGAAAAGGTTTAPIMTAEEMWNIDTKIDDGKPGRGKLLAMYFANCTLSGGNTDFDADYNLANSSTDCTLLFMDPF